MMETRGDRWHREAERHLVRDGVAVGITLALGWGAITAVGCAACDASRESEQARHAYEPFTVEIAVRDRMQAVEEIAARAVEAQDARSAGEAQETVMVQEEPTRQEEYWEPEATYYEGGQDLPTDGLTREGGVNYHDGRTETWYSSNVAHHHRTDEWTVDDEGYYRTDEGYYVVAASDMDEGTVFEGSKGECIVLDGGCDEGVTDYYVAW